MRTFKNNLKRNRNRGSQDRSFKRSIDIGRLNTDFGNRDNGFRRKNNRNNGNVEKLITKYNELAREALSNEKPFSCAFKLKVTLLYSIVN